MVGNSTCGRGETGSRRKASAPESARATVSRVVATGRRIKVSETAMRFDRRVVGEFYGSAARGPALGQAIESEEDHRRGIEGENLADDQTTHDGDAQRAAELGAGAGSQRQRQSGEQS